MKICFIKPLLAVAALLTVSVARADWFSYDGLDYVTLDETTCEVSVNKYCSGTVNIPEQVTNTLDGKVYTVTQIGKRAFNGANNLTGMRIPKTVTVIYDDAFYGSGLGWITIEDSEDPIEFKQSGSSMTRVFDGVPVVNVYIGRDFILPGGLWKANPPFSRNESIQTVEIGDLVTSLPPYAFCNCPNIQSISIGRGLRSIGESAFGDQEFDEESGVQNLYIDNLTQWCNIDFGNVNSNPLACSQGWLHVGGADPTYDIVIPDGVTKINSYAFAGARLNTVTVPSGVTEIGDEVFAGCGGDFQTVYLPEGLQKIGIGAFRDSNLKTIEIPESVTEWGYSMFTQCEELEEAIIKANITDLGENAFWRCANLRTVVLPLTLRVIPDNAFSDCTSLQSIDIPEGVQEIGYAFQWCGLTSVTIPNSVTTIGGYCFSTCRNLASVTIGSGLSEIPDGCFSNTGLTSVTLPDNIITLGTEAFSGCKSLVEANLGKGLKQIKDKCFEESGLKSISIPDKCSSIGNEAFSGCASLATVDLGSGVREIPESCFQNSGLTAVTLPENVTTVGEMSFYGCHSLLSVAVYGPKTFEENAFSWVETVQDVFIDNLADWCERTIFANSDASPFYWRSDLTKLSSLYLDGELVENLVIPDGVVKVGDYSFNSCGSIKTVVIPDGVVTVGKYAFGCPELTKVTIGKTVSSIGDYAFNCRKIEEMTSLNPVPPTVNEFVYNVSNLNFPVYVPAGSVDAYKNADGWRWLNIKEIADGGVGEISKDDISVSVVGGRIVVCGVDDDSEVEVYDLSGRALYAGASAEIPVQSAGVYIVKVSGQTFKVAM